MQRFAVFDIDGTVVRWQLYHAIVDELAAQGHLGTEAHQRIHDARMTWKNRDRSDSFGGYERTLITVYEQALTNLSITAYTQAVDAVFERYKDQVYTYSRDLIRQLKEQGYLLFIISGSQLEIVQKLSEYYGFDDAVGAHYIQKDGHFTGEMESVYDRKDKLLQAFIDKHDVTLEGSVAIGDSDSDIAMLEMVQRPIAFNPTNDLFEHATKKGWEIVVERKNVVYQLQAGTDGYILAKTN